MATCAHTVTSQSTVGVTREHIGPDTHTSRLTVVTLAWRRGLRDDVHKCKMPPVLPHTGELYLRSPLPQVILCKIQRICILEFLSHI